MKRTLVAAALAFAVGCTSPAEEPDAGQPPEDAEVTEDVETPDADAEEPLEDPECAPDCELGAACVRDENCADEEHDRYCDRTLSGPGASSCSGDANYYYYPLVCSEGTCAVSTQRVRDDETCELEVEGLSCQCSTPNFPPVASTCTAEGTCDCTHCDPVNGFCAEADHKCCRSFCIPNDQECS